MKNRRIAIVAFMLVATLTLGIGYAAITDVLDFQGTAKVTAQQASEAFDLDVYFSEVTASQDGSYTTRINADNNDKITFTITSGLNGQGDKVVIPAVIANAGDVPAELSIKSTYSSEPDYFTVTCNFVEGTELDAANADQEPSTVNVELIVELIKTPTEDIEASFVLEVNATSAEATNDPNQ